MARIYTLSVAIVVAVSSLSVAQELIPRLTATRALTGHVSAVTAVWFSGDGKRIASLATNDGHAEVIVWDATNGRQIQMLRPEGVVAVLALDKDGNRLAATGDRTAVWDLTQPAIGLAPVWKSAVAGRQVAFSHTATEIFVAPSPGPSAAVTVLRARDGQVQRNLKADGKPVTALTCSPDGAWLAAGGADGRVHIWNLADGAVRSHLKVHRSPVRAIALSSDGKSIASLEGETTEHAEMNVITVSGGGAIWDRTTGVVRHEMLFIWDGATAFTADGKTVVTASIEGWILGATRGVNVDLLDPATGRQLERLVIDDLPVAVRLSDDGGRIALAIERSVKVFDIPPARSK
jgi:WD40 repeat protein